MAQSAARHFDHVVNAPFPDCIESLPSTHFDLIIFTDVLEHLVDGGAALAAAKPLLSSSGEVLASIPNVRHRSVVLPLVFRGEWTYEEFGLLDRTHLRFFTRSSMLQLFLDGGWEVGQVAGVNPAWHWRNRTEPRRVRLLRLLTRGKLDEFFFVQYVVRARPCAANGWTRKTSRRAGSSSF